MVGFQDVLLLISSHDGIRPQVWNSMTVVERVLSHNWRQEAIIAITFSLYLLSMYFGVRGNRARVDRFMDAIRPLLTKEFSSVGTSKDVEVIKDSHTRYTSYATGRQNVASLLMRFHLVDRHNFVLVFLGLFFPSLRSTEGLRDQVDLVLTPHDERAPEPMIFAVVHKDHMQKLRSDNYYLSLTRTTDSERLPREFVFMSEHSEVIESMYTNDLTTALSKAAHLVEYFSLSDQGIVHPEKVEDLVPHPRIRLSLRYPSNDAEQSAIAGIVQAAVEYFDFVVARKPLRSEVAKKLRATRDAEVAKLTRAADAVKKEQLEQQRAQERRAAALREDDKTDRKSLKKQQDKELRKQQRRMKV